MEKYDETTSVCTGHQDTGLKRIQEFEVFTGWSKLSTSQCLHSPWLPGCGVKNASFMTTAVPSHAPWVAANGVAIATY